MANQPNPFVNPHHRGYELPAGCKDLHEVLAMAGQRGEIAAPSIEAGVVGDIRKHLFQLYEYASPSRVLMLINAPRNVLVFVWFTNLKPKLWLLLRDKNTFLEEAIRELFGEGSLPPGNVRGAQSPKVELPLPNFADDAAQCIIDLFIRGFGMQSQDRLYFIRQEVKERKS